MSRRVVMPSDAHNRDSRHAIEHVEAVLRRWDPIGVLPGPGDDEGPVDEYDSYAPEVVILLRDGAGVNEIEEYLHEVRTRRMGLPRVLGVDRPIAEELAEWWRSRS